MGMDIVPELIIAFKVEENGNVANDNDARGASRYFSDIFSKLDDRIITNRRKIEYNYVV